MKVLFTNLLLAILLIGCKHNEANNAEKETHQAEESKSLIDQKNPLNKLKYANTIDFYCKMDITKYGVSDTTIYKGKLYGFCSTMCKHEFLLKPKEYLSKK